MSKLLFTLAAVLCLALLSASIADASPLREKLASQLAHSMKRTLPAKALGLNSVAPVAAVAAPMSFSTLAVHQLKSMGSLSQRAASMPTAMRVNTAELSTGAIVGIVIGGIVLLFLLSALCCYHRKYVGVPMQSGGGGTTIINTGGQAPAAQPTSTVVV